MKKSKQLLDDLDKALEGLEKEFAKEYCLGWKDGIATGMILVALVFGLLCTLLHL